MTSALAPYPGPEEREKQLDRAARRLDAELVEYGRSVQGRPLRGVRVAATESMQQRVLCTANIHGIEYLSAQIALGLLDRLAGPDPATAQLRQHTEVWVLPCLNPDGYAAAWERDGRGPVQASRTNANGVDLNRNFPLPPGGRASRMPGLSSDRPGASTYGGPGPLSEPETASLDTLLREQRFVASVNLHCFMGTVIPARGVDRPQFEVYRQLSRSLIEAQTAVRYRRLASRWVRSFTGELKDHQHHGLGCWAVCLESMSVRASLAQGLRAERPFWRFNPRQPGPWIDNDVPALVAYYLAAIARGPAGDWPKSHSYG